MAQSITQLKDPYFALANEAPFPVVFEGEQFPSVTHAFLAARSGEQRLYKRIQEADVETLTKLHDEMPVRRNWTTLQIPTMYLLLRDKFVRNAKARTALINTQGDFELAGDDKRWTMGPEGDGENRLGKLLGVIREQMAQGQWAGGPDQ
jgi:predicted NAD-dependent protein-ADP-ribosyltransferase YbiA (DUF1768 family)